MKKIIKNGLWVFLVALLISSCATSEYSANKSAKPQEKDYTIYNNLTEVLRAEGVIVTMDGQILLRGRSSINLNNSALIVVDGVPMGNNVNTISSSLNPLNIDDVEIMRSASSATMRFGEAGRNGAVLIATKANKKDEES